jgi:ubiquinone/menaquinone biosynthesis C-methylase UbiE
LLLDKSFAEITRVLKKGGVFVTWVSFVPGARPYDPYRTDIQAIDKFHLFHFDKPWYEEFMNQYFIELERSDYPGSSFVSYVVRK